MLETLLVFIFGQDLGTRALVTRLMPRRVGRQTHVTHNLNQKYKGSVRTTFPWVPIFDFDKILTLPEVYQPVCHYFLMTKARQLSKN